MTKTTQDRDLLLSRLKLAIAAAAPAALLIGGQSLAGDTHAASGEMIASTYIDDHKGDYGEGEGECEGEGEGEGEGEAECEGEGEGEPEGS